MALSLCGERVLSYLIDCRGIPPLSDYASLTWKLTQVVEIVQYRVYGSYQVDGQYMDYIVRKWNTSSS